MSISGSILFDRDVIWVYQSQSMSKETTKELISVSQISSTERQTFCSIAKHEWTSDFFRQCRHMSISGSILFNMVDSWAYQGRFYSTETSYGYIRVNQCRKRRQKSWSGSIKSVRQNDRHFVQLRNMSELVISFDSVDTWAYQGQFYSTWSIHEHIRVDFIRQRRHMGISESINVERGDKGVDQGQSIQFDRTKTVCLTANQESTGV